MSNVERFTSWRQREALTSLVNDPRFLSTAEGVAFREQIHEHFVASMMKMARELSFPIEPAEIENTILVGLLENEGRVAKLAITASQSDPWAYIAVSARKWIRALWGTRGVPAEILEWIPQSYAWEPDTTSTDLAEVIELTFQTLAPVTDEDLHPELAKLLSWLAYNPQQRLSYERDECVAAHRACPSFTIDQVIAVMNIAWGGRPRKAETSLMGAFLLDPNFQISESSTHALARETYRRRMVAARNGSRLLSDWK